MSKPDLSDIERKPKNARVAKHAGDVMYGVTISWLTQAFDMERKDIRKKLQKCEPLRYIDGGNIPVYDFVEAVSWIVKPKQDIKGYLKTIQPKDLPQHLQKAFWEGKIRRQKWEERARHLWHTDKVVEVFSDVFRHIRTSILLWGDDVESKKGLSAEQRKSINELADALLDDIHDKLVRFHGKKKTGSSFEESGE